MKAGNFFTRFFLVVVSSLVAFLVFDLVSSRFLTSRSPFERQFPVQDVRHPKPYVMFGGRPGAADLNGKGYRGTYPSMPKPAGEYRIIVLGGSTVFKGNPALPGMIEEACTARKIPGVRVYNFGVVSSVSGMELSRIVFEVSELSPDLIIFYNGGNDILLPWSYDPRPGYPFNFVVYEHNPILENDIRDYPALALFAYGSNVLRTLMGGYFMKRFVPLESLRTETGRGSEAWRERIAENYLGTIVKAEKIATAFGSRFIVFFQPLVYYRPSPAEPEKRIISDEGKHAGVAAYAAEMRSRIIRKAESAAETERIFVDLSGIFDQVPEAVFEDPIHITDRGNRLVAEQIAERLGRLRLVPAAAQ